MGRSGALVRTRWAAFGAAVAVSLGAGGMHLAGATVSTGDKPVYVSVPGDRILDTRNNIGLTGLFFDGSPRDLRVTGSVSVAPSGSKTVVPAGATGVVVTATVVDASGPGFLSVRPKGAEGVPQTSNVNFAAGETVANAVTVDLPADGGIQIWFDTFPDGGTAHVLIDVVGFLDDHTHDDRYYTETESDGRYYERAQADAAFLDQTEADGRYYERAQADAAFLDQTEADARYPSRTVREAYSPWDVTVRGGDEPSTVNNCVTNGSGTSSLILPLEIPIGAAITGASLGVYNQNGNTTGFVANLRRLVGQNTPFQGNGATTIRTTAGGGTPDSAERLLYDIGPVVPLFVNSSESFHVEFFGGAPFANAICSLEVTYLLPSP